MCKRLVASYSERFCEALTQGNLLDAVVSLGGKFGDSEGGEKTAAKKFEMLALKSV